MLAIDLANPDAGPAFLAESTFHSIPAVRFHMPFLGLRAFSLDVFGLEDDMGGMESTGPFGA